MLGSLLSMGWILKKPRDRAESITRHQVPICDILQRLLTGAAARQKSLAAGFNGIAVDLLPHLLLTRPGLDLQGMRGFQGWGGDLSALAVIWISPPPGLTLRP